MGVLLIDEAILPRASVCSQQVTPLCSVKLLFGEHSEMRPVNTEDDRVWSRYFMETKDAFHIRGNQFIFIRKAPNHYEKKLITILIKDMDWL